MMKNSVDKIVIDTHNHIGARPDCVYLGETLIIDMDTHGQDKAIIFQMNENWEYKTPNDNPYTGNDYIHAMQSKYPNRLVGLATINPWYQGVLKPLWGIDEPSSFTQMRNRSVEEVERCIIDLKLHGLKLHPMLHGFHVNDPILMPPIMDKLNQLQNKVNKQMIMVVHCMADSVFNSPEAFGGLAKKYPDIIMLMAHAGAVWGYSTAIGIVKKHKNIIMDFTWGPSVGMLKEAISELGAERICIGSDSPFSHFAVKHVMVNEATKDEEERQMILGGTIAKILNI